ncbi:MAG: hypothetical protein Q7S12_00640, partial [bacterium]|nr:hypothetical protein [bacterium]
DAGSNIYYLFCKATTAPATSTTGTWPACDGSGTWATSTAASAASTTATYTTLSGDAENNAWYAFACDDDATNQLCAAVSQGTGAVDAQYSPFATNHAPSLTAVNSSGNLDPGATVTIYASSTDADSASVDTVTMYACKAADGTSSGCGAGGTWCSTVSATADPTCNYAVPTPTADAAYTYYVYIFDNHSFASSPASLSSSFTVNNVAPVVSQVKLNNDSAISLTENATTSVPMQATVSDNNGCSDISTAIATVFRQASSTSCTAQDDNFCYFQMSLAITGCAAGAVDATSSANVDLWYHADATSGSVPFSSDIWDASTTATDNNSASHSATTTTPVEMNTTLGVADNTVGIEYGGISAGSNSVTLNATSTLASTGNTSLDFNTTSTFMTSGANTIDPVFQEYSTTSAVAIGSGTKATSTADQVIDLDLPKTTATATQATAGVYWGISVPSGQTSGTYAGETKYDAVLNGIPWP